MLRKVAFVILALAATGPVWAREHGKFTIGSGQIGWLETTVPPEIRCVGGELTGGFPYCSPETNRVLGRNEVQIWAPASLSGPLEQLLNGPITFTVNCNLDPNLRGPCWGTFTWDVPNTCTWEGHWVAPVMDLMTYESEIMMEGFGECDALGGSHLKLDGYSNPGDWYITFRARIAE